MRITFPSHAPSRPFFRAPFQKKNDTLNLVIGMVLLFFPYTFFLSCS